MGKHLWGIRLLDRRLCIPRHHLLLTPRSLPQLPPASNPAEAYARSKYPRAKRLLRISRKRGRREGATLPIDVPGGRFSVALHEALVGRHDHALVECGRDRCEREPTDDRRYTRTHDPQHVLAVLVVYRGRVLWCTFFVADYSSTYYMAILLLV